MRLVSVSAGDSHIPAVLSGEQVVDLSDVLDAAGIAISAPPSARQAIREGWLTPKFGELAATLATEGRGRPLREVRLGPPIPDPEKIICVGLNYRDHAAESDMAVPTAPVLFAKFRNSLAGPRWDIPAPSGSTQLDYEAELAVVIGRTAKSVPVEDALDTVAGVMAFNDVSARDLQHSTGQWLYGKAIDGFGPCGPALVTLDEAGPLDMLAIRAWVNDRLVQDGNTTDMIFDVPYLVSYLSQVITLEPGDIIATGTPAGVGAGRRPPSYLTDGDVVTVEIPGVGRLTNTVRAGGTTVR